MKDVALTYAGAGRYSGFSSLSNMAPRDDNPDPFDSARGIALARAMDHPLLKAIAMAWIANRLSEDGKQTEARKLVAEALAIARAILPFLAVEIIVIFLITYVPAISMTIPRLTGFVQ